MTAIPQTTQRRLKKLPQTPSVWEGDRRPLENLRGMSGSKGEGGGECIIWVDGSEGFVRAMDVVPPEMGPEAAVRTLLRAMETPHSPAQPARPQKIVVRNRELQFFLRGALQDLQIAIDYVPELPLIDELFRSFEAVSNARPPLLPPEYEPLLVETAAEIWEEAPWELLADHDIIGIELNRWDVGTIYICVMGMLGQEYGAILYRSLESLKEFRRSALAESETEQLEKAFLAQDCWFLNYEPSEEEDLDEDEGFDLAELPADAIRPLLGSVHPYEGIRSFLDEEEAKTVYVALQAFLRFFRSHQDELAEETIARMSEGLSIALPSKGESPETVSVTISTLPELSDELLEMSDDLGGEEEEQALRLSIRDDLVPDNAFLSLGMVPWDLLERLQAQPKTYYQSQGAPARGEGMPVVLIQTSRPKAKEMIAAIQEAGGLRAICFNPGEDSLTGATYDLGLLQTEDGHLYIFGEFVGDSPEHVRARQKWDVRCQATEGYCGLIVAGGVTGASRGNPQPQDMMAFFETKALDARALALGILQLMPQFD